MIAPLGKRYVMQSYAQYIDENLTISDLNTLASRLAVPPGWEYRARTLVEDLSIEDFQGLATALRDPLANTYQRAERLETLLQDQIAVELYNPETLQYWTTYIDIEDAERFSPGAPWIVSRHTPTADKSVYAQSPDAELDGRFAQLTIGDRAFYHSASDLCAPELHASGLIYTNQSRRFQELTFRSGRTIPYIVNHLGETFVLVSESPESGSFVNSLPKDWYRGEVQLAQDWQVVFNAVIKTVATVDGSRLYHGPIVLPGEPATPPPTQIFTHKMILPTGENPFAQKAYECHQCTFEQLESVIPPPGWIKGPTQIVLATGTLRSTPCNVPSTIDFLAEVPGNEYQIIARPRDGRLLELTPQGPIVLTTVERDTELSFPAGRRVHELTSPEGDTYVMFGYGVDSMDVDVSDFSDPGLLDNYPRPTGWRYATRILERELVLDSKGAASVMAFRGSMPFSTWEKR